MDLLEKGSKGCRFELQGDYKQLIKYIYTMRILDYEHKEYQQLRNLRTSRQKEGLLLRGMSVALQRLSNQVSGARTII